MQESAEHYDELLSRPMMVQHFHFPAAEGSISPAEWYRTLKARPGFIPDAAQETAIHELEALWQQLIEFKARRNRFLGRSLFSPPVPMGLYMWGGVGRGKSFLMDIFFACLPYRRKRRMHFHDFMAGIHEGMKAHAGKKDGLSALAADLAQSVRVLCLDEFHVSDIADAMILGRLLEALLDRGVVLLATSNYPPDGLYPNGLQRQNFLPAIDLLKRSLTVLNVDGGSDHRLRSMIRAPVFMVPDSEANEASMSAMFQRLCSGALQDERNVKVRDRLIAVNRLAHGMAWFDFNALCGGPRGQEDYLEIAGRFHTIFVSHIPKFTAAQAAEAQRFAWLVDVLYDNRVKLVASAAAMPQELAGDRELGVDLSRTASRLVEMQARSYLELPHRLNT